MVFDIGLTIRFRGVERRQGMLLRGPAGWAEWSPFPEYDDDEATNWLRAAAESAMFGAPTPVRSQVPVNAIVPALSPAEAARRVREAGCATAKVKVAQTGQQLADDIARVAAVRQALGPQGKIRLDANGAWSVPQAMAALQELADYGLEYVEQPCAQVSELAELRRLKPGVLIAADESIRRAADPLRVRAAGAADIAVLKVQPLGGIRACLQLVEQLEMPVVVSSALETTVGLRAGLGLAAALPELPYACGLETGALLTADVATPPLRAAAGQLPVGELNVEESLLPGVAATKDVRDWWFARLRRVAAHLPNFPELEAL